MSTEVTTVVGRDSVSATAFVAAPPGVVFEYLRRPLNHIEINGARSVRGTLAGPPVLGPGDRFGMRMRIGLPYRVTSRVVEFEPGHRIAWCHFAGHRWRWELEPAGAGTTVTETFDQSTARRPLAAIYRLIRLPRRHQPNITRSVANLAEHFR
jgi:hypothetical protein